MKVIRHTCNSLVKPTFTLKSPLMYIKGQWLQKIPKYAMIKTAWTFECYIWHSTVGTFKGLFKSICLCTNICISYIFTHDFSHTNKVIFTLQLYYNDTTSYFHPHERSAVVQSKQDIQKVGTSPSIAILTDNIDILQMLL